jgi:hypothetical protein
MQIRWGGSNVNQIGLFAKELVALQPDLIVAQGTPVTAALHRETPTIPDRVCSRDRSSRRGIRYVTLSSWRKYHRLLDVRVDNWRQDARAADGDRT